MRWWLVGVAVVVAVAPTPASWVEGLYSQRAYLVTQNLVTPASSLIGFAVFDLLLVVVLVGAPWWVVAAVRQAPRGGRLRATARGLLDLVALAAALYLVFVVAWGLNYRRVPLSTKLDFSRDRVNHAALVDLTMEAVDRLNALHPRAHAIPWSTLDELPARMTPAFERVQVELGADWSATPGTPKATILSPYFRLAGIDGMISPFSLEVLINGWVLPFERPFVVAHEWAHLAGYADESEASFVGLLTCLSGDEAMRYSAWLALVPYLMRHLDRSEQATVWAQMGDGPVEDFRAIAERVSAAAPVVQQSANRVYDQYLRANRVEQGIASYGLVVDLVLGTPLGRTTVQTGSGGEP